MNRRGPLDRGSFWASASVHAAVAAFLFWVAPALREEAVAYEVVQVSFASPPPLPAEEEVPPAPEDELVVETPQPEPEPAPPEPEPEPVLPDPDPVLPEPSPPEPEEEEAPDPPPDPEPPATEPEEQSPPPPPDAPAEETADAPAAAPTEDAENAEEDGRDMAARMEGLRRDYPEYYANIIAQMERCFRSRGSRLEATVTFRIARDGTTSEIGIERSSGSFAFDLDAQGAAECAGKANRLGPLPEDYPWAFIPVRFTFSPRTRGP